MKDLIDAVTDIDILKNSLAQYFSEFSVSKAIMTILMIFMVVGLADKLRGNKKGYGKQFDEGFMAMGPLALSVLGIVSLSPVLITLLSPVITPVYSAVGASPAMFPSSLLALDMGGYVLATQLAGDNAAIGVYSGIIVASMMGITMSFTIPYALTVMKKKDHHILATGVLIGMVTMPLGCIAGGLLMFMTPYEVSFAQLLINTLPVIILSAVIACGLIFFRKITLKIFIVFGKAMTFIITAGSAIAVFQYITGVRFPLFSQMVEHNEMMDAVPLEAGLLLVGQIAIVLIGAFPMIHFLNKILAGPIEKFGNRVKINNIASTGLLTQLASSIPMLSLVDKMNNRGKLYNIAFAVSGSFVLGDVLAFVGGREPSMTFPVIAAKLIAGITAIILVAVLPVSKNMKEEVSDEKHG